MPRGSRFRACLQGDFEMVMIFATLEVIAEWLIPVTIMYAIAYSIMYFSSYKLKGFLVNISSFILSLLIVSFIDIAFRIFSPGEDFLVDANPIAIMVPNVFSVPFAISLAVIFVFWRRYRKSEAGEV
jgi:hypothetical protein